MYERQCWRIPSFVTSRGYVIPMPYHVTRWLSYLIAWFSSGLKIAAPPADNDCILNEPIWFNRFLYLKADTKHGRLLKKDTEERLIKRGFTHLSDLCLLQDLARCHDGLKKPAIFLTGSPSLGAAIYSFIDLSPYEWSRIVKLKI
jgi:hypothetical protein